MQLLHIIDCSLFIVQTLSPHKYELCSNCRCTICYEAINQQQLTSDYSWIAGNPRIAILTIACWTLSWICKKSYRNWYCLWKTGKYRWIDVCPPLFFFTWSYFWKYHCELLGFIICVYLFYLSRMKQWVHLSEQNQYLTKSNRYLQTCCHSFVHWTSLKCFGEPLINQHSEWLCFDFECFSWITSRIVRI